MNRIIQDGVRPDPRPLEAKQKDYIHIPGVVTPNWVEKNVWKTYTQRNQDGSFSCVFQSAAKALEVLTGKVISATPYFWRKNYPEAGAFLQDAGDVFYNRYSCTETASPSQNQDEVTMNTIKPLTTNIGITGYRTIHDPTDIDSIAEALEAYKQCLLIFYTNGDEWEQTPKYLGTQVTFGHCICATDYGLVNGVKTILCEDSAGWWSSANGLRFITEDFLANRCKGAMYFLGSKDVTVPQDQQFIFKNTMVYGQTSEDIKQLQKRLGVIQTGYYGDLTTRAVLAFQIKNISLTWYERYVLRGTICGKKTLQSLNSVVSL